MSLVDYKADLIPFPKDRIVRTRAMQRKLQEMVTGYLVDINVSVFAAFMFASSKLEGPRNRTEDLA